MKFKISKKIIISIYFFIIFVLPILGMMNCSEWSEAAGNVGACVVDFPILRLYAMIYWGFLFLSIFTFFIPIIIYFAVGISVSIFLFKAKKNN